MDIVEAIAHVASRRSLKEQEAREVMAAIMDGEATPSQIAGLLVALHMKGESTAELTGFARVMREKVLTVPHGGLDVVDTCGTGGDSFKSFNLSTVAAIIASAAGAKVAKHGNRAVTSKCGSADVLESLGVRLDIGPEEAARQLKQVGLAFLFAPNYHPAMKHAAGPRREMKLRTVFNLLGPLTNPAGASRQLLGVYSPHLVQKLAQVLKRLGSERCAVVHGMIGLDEVSPIGPTRMAVLSGGVIEVRVLQADEFGIVPPELHEIAAGETVEENAQKLQTAISDADSPECRAALPGAGVAIWLAGLSKDFREGTAMAREAVAAGKALEKLAALKGGK